MRMMKSLAIGSLLALALVGAGCGEDGPQGSQTQTSAVKQRKYTICHATGSETNPYVEITISGNALYHHLLLHQDGLDFILQEGQSCPGNPPPCECECDCDCLEICSPPS
jgi:hypothetical protein